MLSPARRLSISISFSLAYETAGLVRGIRPASGKGKNPPSSFLLPGGEKRGKSMNAAGFRLSSSSLERKGVRLAVELCVTLLRHNPARSLVGMKTCASDRGSGATELLRLRASANGKGGVPPCGGTPELVLFY